MQFESSYVEGKQHGIVKSWWRNGRMRSFSEYRANELVGLNIGYFEDGTTAYIQVISDEKIQNEFINQEKDISWFKRNGYFEE